MKYRLPRIILTVGLTASLLWSHSASPAQNNGPAKAVLQSGAKLQRIQQGISSHKERIQQTEASSYDLQLELGRITGQLRDGQSQLKQFQEKLLKQEAHLLKKEKEIALIQQEKLVIEQHVKKRLAAFYQTGDVALMNTLFSASTLPELLNLQEYLQAMFHYDNQMVDKYRTQMALLAGAKEAISQAKDNILEVILKIKDQEQQLISQQLERSALLERCQTEEKLFRQALMEMEKAAAALSKTMREHKVNNIQPRKQKIVRRHSSKKSRPSQEAGFAALKGQLAPPVDHASVVRFFGAQKDASGAPSNSSGISLLSKAANEVRAVYEGRVFFSGRMKGYGELIIIEHGEQYYSLIAGLGERLKQEGEPVATSELIGHTESGGKSYSLVHFEIRQGPDPVDPLLWLDHTRLSIAD